MKILSAEFVTSAVKPAQFPIDRKPQIAFAGRSNVGKSSLINAVLNRKGLVKTSSTPGKTQLINFFLINEKFYFVDLPGYGYAKVPKAVTDQWGPMIEGYLKKTPQLLSVLLLLDIRRTPDERDRVMVDWLRHYNIPALFVLTKADKLKRQETVKAKKEIGAALGLDGQLLLTSATSGEGIAALRSEISRLLTQSGHP